MRWRKSDTYFVLMILAILLAVSLNELGLGILSLLLLPLTGWIMSKALP